MLISLLPAQIAMTKNIFPLIVFDPSRQMLHALDLNQIVVGDAVSGKPRLVTSPLFFQSRLVVTSTISMPER